MEDDPTSTDTRSDTVLGSNPAETTQPQSSDGEDSDAPQSPRKATLPLQKRRRVTRAW